MRRSLRSGSPGCPLDFLERLPGLRLRPLPLAFGRLCYRTGFAILPLQQPDYRIL